MVMPRQCFDQQNVLILRHFLEQASNFCDALDDHREGNISKAGHTADQGDNPNQFPNVHRGPFHLL